VDVAVGKQPLTLVRVKGDVHWLQQAAGTLNFGTKQFNTWTGGSIIQDWPKPGSGLANGWIVAAAWALDGGAQYGSPQPHHFHWEAASGGVLTAEGPSGGAVHQTGDTMSEDYSWTTFPCGGIIYESNIIRQPGIINPFSTPPVNTPLHVAYTETMVALWTVKTSLTLDYEAQRPRREIVEFQVTSDLQPILTDPNEPASLDTEFVQISGADVGSPIINPLVWFSYTPAGGWVGPVIAGMFVKSTAEFVGQPLYAVCIGFTSSTGGTATATGGGGVFSLGTIDNLLRAIGGSSSGALGGGGSVGASLGSGLFGGSGSGSVGGGVGLSGGSVGATEPAWSDVLGSVIIDGTVRWAMVGPTLPSDFPTWQQVAHSQVTAGTIIKSMYFLATPVDKTGIPMAAPPAGIQAFQICIHGGLTEEYRNALGTGVGDTHPSNPQPPFSAFPGALTADGSAVWMSLGPGGGVGSSIEIPLGLDIGARSYFPKARGVISLGYLISLARAKLLMRSRAIHVTFECKYERAVNLSCRKAVLLYDHRLPGGVIEGKIISYSIMADGDTGVFKGKVTIAAAIGFGGSVSLGSGGPGAHTMPGTPSWVEEGWVQPGWQEYDGAVAGVPPSSSVATVSLVESDIGFTPPRDAPTDDGVVFPITNKNQVIVKEMLIEGQPPGSAAFVADNNMTLTNTYPDGFGGTVTVTYVIAIPNGFTPAEIPVDQVIPINGVFTVVTVNAVVFFPLTQYYLELKPMQGISFGSEYNIKTTPLVIPKMIDLEAPSTP
jgi:hypothetical protein